MKEADLINAQLHESAEVQKAIAEKCIPQIEKAGSEMLKALKNGNKILFCGNGGSASDSQHIAAELVGRFRKERKGLAALSLTVDTSALTAIGNDFSFDQIFARQVEGLGKKGDVLVALSTSGNSLNVIQAAEKAKSQGLYVIGILGKDGGKLGHLVDCAIIVPSKDTQRIQEGHTSIGHILCELIEEGL